MVRNVFDDGAVVGIRLRSLAPATAALALLVAGCAGGSGPTGAGSSSATGAAACTAAAEQAVAAARAPMTIEAPPAFDTSTMRGKKFALVSLRNNVATDSNAAGFTEALAAVGASATYLDGKGSPDAIAQNVRSAITQQVAGIVAIGFDPALVRSAIADAAAAGVPVISAQTGDPDGPRIAGVVANVSPDGEREGALQADYALAASRCNLHGATFYTAAGPVTTLIAKGAAAEVERLCPEACTFQVIDIDAGKYTTALAGQVQTTLQRNPTMSHLFSTADIFVPYILQGAKAVGRDVPVLGAQGDTLDAAIAGSGQVADVVNPPAELVGYYMADSVMRAAAGRPSNTEIPVRLLDASNWGSSADVRVQFPELQHHKNLFREAWGAAT